MIENFTPQPYPLWIVTEVVHGPDAALDPGPPQPVIGWEREPDDRYAAVVMADDGRAGRCSAEGGRVLHAFTDLEEARDDLRADLMRMRRGCAADRRSTTSQPTGAGPTKGDR